MIKLPIEIGDTLLGGKFKNHKIIVKEIGIDEHGGPTVNGKPILKVRMEKFMKKKVVEKKAQIGDVGWKKFYLDMFDGAKVYRVDGNYIRDNIYVEFIEGGHGYVYDFIPKNEIWVENMFNKEDEKHNLLHEIYEWSLMKYGGMNYDDAHDRSSCFETIVRRIDKHTDEDIISDVVSDVCRNKHINVV